MDESARKAAELSIVECGNKWKSNIVARSALKEFSGGAISAGTAANMDSAGIGIGGRFKIGKNTVYPVQEVVSFLIGRVQVKQDGV